MIAEFTCAQLSTNEDVVLKGKSLAASLKSLQHQIDTIASDGVVATPAFPNFTYSALASYGMSSQILPLYPTHHGSPVVRYRISPTLVAGLKMDNLTGVISGTPTAPVDTVYASNCSCCEMTVHCCSYWICQQQCTEHCVPASESLGQELLRCIEDACSVSEVHAGWLTAGYTGSGVRTVSSLLVIGPQLIVRSSHLVSRRLTCKHLHGSRQLTVCAAIATC